MIQRNQVASLRQQNATKNNPRRETFHTPFAKTNQPVSQQMEHWNWLKCVSITKDAKPLSWMSHTELSASDFY